MAKIKTPCTKCFGKGNIRAFSHVQGGVCFSCGGAGYKMVSKSYKPSILFAIEVTCVSSDGCSLKPGQRGVAYNIKARTAAEALRKAKGKWLGARCYPNLWFDPASAEAVPAT